METRRDDFNELQREFKTFEARSEERYKTVFKQLEEVESSILSQYCNLNKRAFAGKKNVRKEKSLG